MLEDGLSYPLRGDSALGRIFIGGLLGVFSFLLVPAFALFGYLVRVLEESARDEEEPPAFEHWGGLVADGLKATLVSIVYAIVPVIVVVVSAGVGGAGVSADGGAIAGIFGALGIVGAVIGTLALFVVYYLIPAALANMAVEGRVGAAFDVGTLKRPLLSLDYFVAWLLPFVIAVFANIVSFFLVLFTLGIGAILLPFLQFYVQVAVFYMFGRAFGSALGITPDEGTSAGEAVPA